MAWPLRQQGSIRSALTAIPAVNDDAATFTLAISALEIFNADTHYLKFNSGTRDGRWYYNISIITLRRHEDGRPVAMIPATGEKEDSEVSEARALLADPQVRLESALVTADPLQNKEATLRLIIEKGSDYLIGTKGNTSNRFDAVQSRSPVDAGLLSAHSAIKVRSEWVEKTCPEDGHQHTRSLIPSLPPAQAARLGRAVREHWSVENKKHHKRDHHVWQEDRHRRVNIVQNLALTRNALLAIIPFDEINNLPSLIVDYQDHKQLAIDLILKATPFP